MTKVLQTMITLKIYFIIVFFSLISCKSEYHSRNVGDYYLFYKDGQILAENDSSNQVYIRLNGDNNFKIRFPGGEELGKWRTIDYDDFSITYFYSNYFDYAFDMDYIGKASVGIIYEESNIMSIKRLNWYVNGKLTAYLGQRPVFCERKKTIPAKELNIFLIRSYGDNAIK